MPEEVHVADVLSMLWGNPLTTTRNHGVWTSCLLVGTWTRDPLSLPSSLQAPLRSWPLRISNQQHLPTGPHKNQNDEVQTSLKCSLNLLSSIRTPVIREIREQMRKEKPVRPAVCRPSCCSPRPLRRPCSATRCCGHLARQYSAGAWRRFRLVGWTSPTRRTAGRCCRRPSCLFTRASTTHLPDQGRATPCCRSWHSEDAASARWSFLGRVTSLHWWSSGHHSDDGRRASNHHRQKLGRADYHHLVGLLIPTARRRRGAGPVRAFVVAEMAPRSGQSGPY